jgi:predicted O-linked N-acetylglucosamine transferase (SPINDLY family)
MIAADPTAIFQQGLALHRQGRLDDAEALYRTVLAAQPAHFGALHLTGLIQYQRGRFVAATEWIGRAIAVDPAVPDAYSNLALALLDLRQPAQALEKVEHALRLRPDSPEFLNNRGNALQSLNRPAKALADYDRAIALRPDFAMAHSNRGNALRTLGRTDEALAAYDRALDAAPGYPEALNNRGRLLRDLKRFDEAAQTFAPLLSLAPPPPYAPGLWFDSRLQTCDWTGYDKTVEALGAAIERGERADAPQSAASYLLSAATLRRCAELHTAAEYPLVAAPLPIASVPGKKRIHLAYLSSDLRNHPVGALVVGLIERHDREKFEVTAISFGPDDGSPLRKRLEGAFDRFHDVQRQSDAAVAALMRRLDVDIAIDLNGLTALHRMGILAERAAPLQVNYLGFPGTTGASFVDYIIADPHVVPHGEERFYSEKVVRLPDSYQANDDRRDPAPSWTTRAQHGLPAEGFVFCSFNNSFKIRPAMFDIWMRLLTQVEGSVLWLLDDNAAAGTNLRRAAGQRGVAAERLVFAPRLSPEAHVARQRHADLFLDTFPYNAHTTGSDALWVGLPIVTLAGDTFASRVASGLLRAAGVPELATRSPADYESLALALARDPVRLAGAKARLKDVRRSRLFDTSRFCAHIERAYATMYERWVRGETPASFDV